jgi:uncharacterized protein YbjT (DUF2867 family)
MILLTGGTGYVGPGVVEELLRRGHDVRVLVRAPGARLPPGASEAVGDVTDPESLRRAVDGADAVVNLVAILDGPDEAFRAVNAGGPRNLVEAATGAGVRRFLHMSALGVTAEHAPQTRYWASKWEGKQTVTGSDRDWTVFEPSFVFGRRGGALKAFEGLARMPVVPVIGDGRYRHQPIWIRDVARAFANALERPQTVRKTYELGGPEAFAFDDLLDEVARVNGRRPHPKVHLPAGMMRQAARVLRFFPPPLEVTREQIDMLLAGTECSIEPMRAELGVDPAPLREAYLLE